LESAQTAREASTEAESAQTAREASTGAPTAPADQRAIRIVLADGHAVVRSGLRMLLDQEHGLEVVAEAADVDAARRYARGYNPTVLVLDLNMPGEPCLEAISVMRSEFPHTHIVALGSNAAAGRRALAAGACAYVPKAAAGRRLVHAVCSAAAGERDDGPLG
jgi:two-component system response regulator NreC